MSNYNTSLFGVGILWMNRSSPRRRHQSILPGLRRAGFIGVALCITLASCEPGSRLASLPVTAAGPYRIGPGEKVRVVVFGQEHLTGEFRVDDNGTIAIPLLGKIPVDGITTAELEHNIAGQLQDKKILLNPSVSVEIISYRQMFILGEVVKPGQYPYEPGMTVLTAVAIAGGFTYRAQTSYASVLRMIDGQSVEGRVRRGVKVRPGDVITIYQRYF